MTLLLLAYLGGILTILSPCILPVLPFTFARADQPFRKSGLPLLISMALTFALVATLTVEGGSWLVRSNQYGRIIALVIFAIVGLTLLFPSLAEKVTQPLVQLGSRLNNTAGSVAQSTVLQSVLLGFATGLLWAPCAGPILGLILAGAAVKGPSAHTSLLLLAYALGAATSLAVVLLAGNRLFSALKRSLGADVWIRRVLGVAVLAGVVMVAFGLDRGLLTKLSLANTSGVEQSLVDKTKGQNLPRTQDVSITVNGSDQMPPLTGATAWINSPPLTREELKGKVVLVDFWTYSCINCLRTLPYVKAWAAKYKDDGLVIIGVHTPEFPFEKDQANVEKAVHDLGVTYPVAMDNDYAIWNAFSNEYWPADYFVDATGNVRFHHFGEGGYNEAEHWIQQLLKERNGSEAVPTGTVAVHGAGAEAAADDAAVESPETYVGYDRATKFASPGGLQKDDTANYREPAKLDLNQWAFVGRWKDGQQIAESLAPGAKIIYHFHARDLHLVLGPAMPNRSVKFRVLLDGKAPGENHGADTDANGNGVIRENRLYQLIRQKAPVSDHDFTIEFADPGAQAFAFTFG